MWRGAIGDETRGGDDDVVDDDDDDDHDHDHNHDDYYYYDDDDDEDEDEEQTYESTREQTDQSRDMGAYTYESRHMRANRAANI